MTKCRFRGQIFNQAIDAMTGSPEHDLHAALTYATHDGVALQGDLYLPKGSGPFPGLVAVHGGGWQQGARSAFQYWGPYLAARGYGLFAISYRLAKKGAKTFPEAVHDVVAAVQFLRVKAAEFRLDPACLAPPRARTSPHWRRSAPMPANSSTHTRTIRRQRRTPR
jgi:acetyl esterase/lipase